MKRIIHFQYVSGIIGNGELDLIKSQLEEYDIVLELHDISGQPQASLEEMISPIVLFLSSDLVQAYLLGLVTAASYDLIKQIIVKIWRQLAGNKVAIITQHKVEHIEPQLDFTAAIPGGSKIAFKLKGNISDELKERCIDKAFEFLNTNNVKEFSEPFICMYDADSEKWECYTYLQFVRKFIKPPIN